MSQEFMGRVTVPLGTVQTIARTTLLLDDCEGTFNWTPTGTEGDDTHEYATACAFMGCKGMQLRTRVTNPAADDVLLVTRSFGYPRSGTLAVRLLWAVYLQPFLKEMRILVDYNAGTRHWRAGLVITPNTPKVEYIGAAGALVAIPSFAIAVPDSTYVTIGLTVDLAATTYVEAVYNGLVASLVGMPSYNVGAEATRYASLGLQITAVGANTPNSYFDNIYVSDGAEA